MVRIKRTLMAAAAACGLGQSAMAQEMTTNPNYFEKLDRGLVVVPHSSGSGKLATWRWLGTDNENTSFEILVNGKSKKKNITATTNVKLTGIVSSSKIQLVTFQDGEPVDTTAEVKAWGSICQQIPTEVPADGVNPANETYSYSPNDCSVGDADGDGQYEIFLKWDPSNSKDNSQGGYTGNVYLDCIKLDGTKLWRIDLGVNIRAGAHYTQFMVWDFDRDGKAELICKTAPGSIDGTGAYVSEAATDSKIKGVNNKKDWRNSGGRIDGGQEWLTVFDGQTGKAIHTIPYVPNRNAGRTLTEASGTFNWGTGGKNDYASYGNRGERYLATVAYLDGPEQNPSVVMCRGYYTYAYLWAVDFDGEQLHNRWLHESKSTTQYTVYSGETFANKQTVTAPKNTANINTSNTAFGNGNHNISCADVDGDGCDEIVWGSCAIDQDGKLLYATGLGHGDAIHLTDIIPERPGLEVFQIHEEGGNVNYGYDLHDAATGEIIYRATGSGDNGRGMVADIKGANDCMEFWSANDRAIRRGDTQADTGMGSQSMCFRIYWDGDKMDELLDGTKLDDPSNGRLVTLYNYNNSSSCNSTKATPNLQADILGDWREEVIMWDSSTKKLNLFTTDQETSLKVPTLMHDHVYRLGVAWQNVAYNQPPHLGYYLPWYLDGKLISTGVDSPISGNSGSGKVVLTRTYTPYGQLVTPAYRGVAIVQTVYSDGHSESKKVIIK